MEGDLESFGRNLRSARERAGLSVDALAGKLKLSPVMVSAMEDGDATRLPSRIFLLAALRSYAEAVGLSGDDVVRRFQGLPEAPQAEVFDPGALEADRRARAVTIAWVVAAGLALLALWATWAHFAVLVMKLGSR